MARSHLTLAALATSAVEGLDVAAAAPFGSGTINDFDAALISGRDGKRWIIRVPRNAAAENVQSADLVALRALSTGVRTRLPFAVTRYAGQVPVGQTRGIVYEFVPGTKVPLRSYTTGPGSLSASIGSAIAAIHGLPTSFVADAGLPVQTASDCLRACVSIIDRAAATKLVPAALLERWRKAAEDSKLWQFQPTVVNGSLVADSFLSSDDEVTGVLGWQDIKVGDPATDLQWLLGPRNDAIIDTAFGAYADAHGAGDRQLKQRATFYAELSVAKWLLHGTEVRSTEIVDDAGEMLTTLLDDIRDDVMNPISANTMPTMAVDEVEAMLRNNSRAG